MRGLWVGEEAVGIFAMIDPQADPRPGDPGGAAYLWRLLIDRRFQGRGHGRAAIAAAQGIAEGWGFRRLYLHALPKPGGAVPYYERLGFRRTGRQEGGEVEMIRF
ncbi:MAG TPA: GNAT family N-acetyltransferase [Paracoccaceae bacterium]|nr:GNAT family N-acetyltransferase [Paracoccaceae bacterium]